MTARPTATKMPPPAKPSQGGPLMSSPTQRPDIECSKHRQDAGGDKHQPDQVGGTGCELLR